MEICVTGGLGYVGSRLVPLLLGQGHSIKVIDLGLYGDYGLEALQKSADWSKYQPKFQLIRGDIRDADAVKEALRDTEAVIHLAAISNDPTGELDDTLTRQVNFDAVGVLLATARSAGVKRFVNASSSSVFGIKHEENVTENLEPEPITSYSRYKMLSEWLVVAAASSDFTTVNIRPATICGYSPRQRFDLTVNKLTADAVRKKVITVHGGEQRRPNVGMNDIVNLYSILLQTDARAINGRTFNFGFENHKVIEIARIIQKQLGDLDVKINVTSTTDNRDYHISSGRIVGELGYSPISSILREVQELRAELERGFPDIDAPEYYNLKTMKIERSPVAYRFLSR